MAVDLRTKVIPPVLIYGSDTTEILGKNTRNFPLTFKIFVGITVPSPVRR